jgi:hypothetical protein
MATTIHRFPIGGAAAFAPLAIAALVSPAVSRAAECGAGTVFDAASNTCIVAEAPPPPPPWNGPTPYVSVSICAPIPFVALCAGI